MNYTSDLLERNQDFYFKAFEIESQQKLSFYQTDIKNRRRNIEKLQSQIADEEGSISQDEAEISAIEAKMSDPERISKEMLFKDFKRVLFDILNGEESQQNGRFGLQVQKQGPYVIEKPFSITRNGKTETEMRTVSLMRLRNNEVALEQFRNYVQQGRNLKTDGSFHNLQKAIQRFFDNAPKPNAWGPEYEEYQLYDQTIVRRF